MSDTFTLPRTMRRMPAREPAAAAAPAAKAEPRMAEPRGAEPRTADPRTAETRGAAPPRAAAPGAAVTPPAPQAAVPADLPQDFVYDTEHPVLPLPFKVQMGEHRLEGTGLSVTAAYVAIDGAFDPRWKGHREIIKLIFDFQGFTVTLFPEAMLVGSREDGEMTLQFMDPAGAHLAQLRYILNSYIAGDFVALGSLMSYTGPTAHKPAAGADPASPRQRLRSIAVAVLSLTLMVGAGGIIFNRLTQSYEQLPVFVERESRDMKATTAGQVSYLNPNAQKGEVVFSINSNAGDVLNFKLPCDCEVVVTEGIYEGATVLPIDSILSLFDSTAGVRVQAQMSIEGLAKAMGGERAYLDLSDGRTLPVRILVTTATNAAAHRGEPFVPVGLVPHEGALSQEDIGKSARLRLSRSWFNGLSSNPAESS